MSKTEIFKRQLIEAFEGYADSSKIKTINATFIIDFKFQSKNMKVFGNQNIEVSHVVDYRKPALFFGSKELYEKQNKDLFVFAFDFKEKQIKKKYKFVAVENTAELKKYKNVIAKKMMLSSNDDFCGFDIDRQIKTIADKKLVKAIRTNNQINCQVGSLNNLSRDQIIDNIVDVFNYISKNENVVKVFVHQCLQKGIKITL